MAINGQPIHFPILSAVVLLDDIEREGDAVMIALQREAPSFSEPQPELKLDNTPVTQWDHWVDVFVQKLLNKSEFPLMSEESLPEYADRKDWEAFWVLDPIDGTKELLHGTGQYCSVLAFVAEGEPLIGWILDYRNKTIYKGGSQTAFQQYKEADEQWTSVEPEDGPKVFLVSNHFLNPKDLKLMESLVEDPAQFNHYPLGSALKFLEVAKNRNAYYSRVGRIMEWDVAAGVAICASVGKKVVSLTGDKIEFNKAIPEVVGFRIT